MDPRPTLIDRAWRVALVIAWTLRNAYWFLVRPSTPSVNVAVWHASRVLVIRNSYRASASFPGGGVHRREALLEAARRELVEEVGIEVGPEEIRWVEEIRVRHPYREDRAQIFEVRMLEQPEVRIDRREVSWARFLDVNEALAFPELAPEVRIYLEAGLKARPRDSASISEIDEDR